MEKVLNHKDQIPRRATISPPVRPDEHHTSVKGTWKFAWNLPKRHLKNCQVTRKKILVYDTTKIELFGLNAKYYILRKPDMAQYLAKFISAVKHSSCIIMLLGWFSLTRTGRLVSIEKKMNRSQYQKIVEENLIRRAQDLIVVTNVHLLIWQGFVVDSKENAESGLELSWGGFPKSLLMLRVA